MTYEVPYSNYVWIMRSDRTTGHALIGGRYDVLLRTGSQELRALNNHAYREQCLQ